jgi:hypothetical protein
LRPRLIPALTPAARNPRAAVTPPGIHFIVRCSRLKAEG